MGCAKPTVSTLGLGDSRSMGVHGLAGSAVTLSLFLSPALGKLRSRPPPTLAVSAGVGSGGLEAPGPGAAGKSHP